jgi:NhaP-type Na+/H+ or K+/H+ antiporter
MKALQILVGNTHTKQLFGRQRRRLEESVEIFFMFIVCRIVMYNAWEYSSEHIKWHKFTILLFLYLYMHILVVYIKMQSFCFLLPTADVIANM